MRYEFIEQHPSIPNLLISNNGMAISTTASRNGNKMAVLKKQISMDGYVVYKINGKTRLAHRLVAETFIPNPDNLPEVDHINGNKQDNSQKNLRWVSHKDNMKNIHPKEKKDKYVVYDSQHSFVGKFSTQKEIHEKLKIGLSSIQNCVNGKWEKACGYFIQKEVF